MKFSLKKKTAIFIIMNALLLTGTAIVICGSIITNLSDELYRAKANDIAGTLAASVDVDAVKDCVDSVMEIYNGIESRVSNEEMGSDQYNKYISNFSEIEEKDSYNKILTQTRNIQDVNNVDCLYIICADVKNKVGVYIMDAAYDDKCPSGSFDPIFPMNDAMFQKPEIGFPAYITNTAEYGWLVTAGKPIFDEDKNVIAYAMVDISMDMIKNKQNKYLYTLIAILMIFTTFISVFVIVFVNKRVVKPINELSEAAVKYCQDKYVTKSQLSFADIDINSGDEIESLAESMKQMERDINDNIANLIATSEELTHTRIQADIMNELATKDALTGVRNKMSYDIELERLADELSKGKMKFGLAMIDLNFLKRINDNYGHEKGNIMIRKLCNIVCSTFVHSPVFRIGGDEFVVVLQNADYDNIKELVEAFNIIIDELANNVGLEPWERVSAAIGYALYDPRRDVSVDDVFKRADGAMYLKKKQMKSIRV